MQSGITASQELREAFNELVASTTAQRGIIASIEKETLVPSGVVASRSPDFFEDLASLAPLLKDNEAAYVILCRYANAPDGFVAVTYVPDTANVRQKMLFASTRLTLVRELGAERFRDTLFATSKEELTADGWQKHDKHEALKAPLTEEEQTLQGVKEAEAETSRGTTERRSHFTHGLRSPISSEAIDALKGLPDGEHNLVQMKIDLATENVELASASNSTLDELSKAISDREPRYSFFRYSHEHEGQSLSPIIFISSCPSGLKVKERMLYATSRAVFLNTASQEAGLDVSKKLEVSDPSEILASSIHEDFHPKVEQKQGFSRPKRPGKK